MVRVGRGLEVSLVVNYAGFPLVYDIVLGSRVSNSWAAGDIMRSMEDGIC